jgi:hypothetical protein
MAGDRPQKQNQVPPGRKKMNSVNRAIRITWALQKRRGCRNITFRLIRFAPVEASRHFYET